LRAAGLTLPFADPRRHHGTALEGWFWRFTWPDGRAALVLCGVCDGWALAGMAASPGFFRSEILDAPQAAGLGVRVGGSFAAEPERLRLELGPDCRLDAQLHAPARWPRRAWGGLGAAGWMPGLGQYWHPHVLRAGATGSLVAGDARWDLADAAVYAEKNWGHGFPTRWWWGEAHDFGDDPVTVAFAGGRVLGGAAARGPGGRFEATALVVRLDGRLVRLGEPVLGPVAIETGPGTWRLRGRTLRHTVEVEGSADPASAHRLDVPVPAERRVVPWSHHHVAGGALRVHLRRRGRTVYAGESANAGLELGWAPGSRRVEP
jgi:Tocopherol cyclase